MRSATAVQVVSGVWRASSMLGASQSGALKRGAAALALEGDAMVRLSPVRRPE